MAENSKIEWTTHTFNPWIGCTRVSPGCQHCYAESLAKRTGLVQWGPQADRRVTSDANWRQPLRGARQARETGTRPRGFCASLADVFEDRPELEEPRLRLFSMIWDTIELDWLLLTKRPENIRQMLPKSFASDPWPNVWLGTTVEDQQRANERIPHLLATPAAVRFLSCEPLLGPVDLRIPKGASIQADYPADFENRSEAQRQEWFTMQARATYMARCETVDWVICGGESGPGARPMHANWARSLRDQCQNAKVPFFFKQWGEWAPPECEFCADPQGVAGASCTCGEEEMVRVGKKRAGRLLDDDEWSQFPEVRRG